MSSYFYAFPTVKYQKKLAIDITRRVKFIDIDPIEIYLPYTVEEGERPEDIANFYYGSVEYTWLVYFANNIMDPSSDWVLTSDQLNDKLISLYKSKGDTRERILNWTKRSDIIENIVEFHLPGDVPVSVDTAIIDLVPFSEKHKLDTIEGQKELFSAYIANSIYEPIRVYDMAEWENEQKRQIRLIDKNYLNQAIREFEEKMKE